MMTQVGHFGPKPGPCRCPPHSVASTTEEAARFLAHFADGFGATLEERRGDDARAWLDAFAPEAVAAETPAPAAQ